MFFTLFELALLDLFYKFLLHCCFSMSVCLLQSLGHHVRTPTCNISILPTKMLFWRNQNTMQLQCLQYHIAVTVYIIWMFLYRSFTRIKVCRKAKLHSCYNGSLVKGHGRPILFLNCKYFLYLFVFVSAQHGFLHNWTHCSWLRPSCQ